MTDVGINDFLMKASAYPRASLPAHSFAGFGLLVFVFVMLGLLEIEAFGKRFRPLPFNQGA
ncbi:hypothetical protein N8E89_22390 (plasmid) [Phyllobacterium sp. A18/5-2]|uniref:hypothetical protein n=1 Tax=Phyllobacterium sp. A18/5-2 TaxID=2978392 RepID=UPI0021C737BB|nr:hypothetical protein [Phyllobacterium sp. A18/5-2]UXN66003.1 hypothetical protein N8E89_22390 [Phyllobacterium sp. A18/5-2]